MIQTWQDMLRIYDGVEDRNEHGENMEQINNLVSTIDPEDKQFKDYINTRLQRINLLRSSNTNITYKYLTNIPYNQLIF